MGQALAKMSSWMEDHGVLAQIKSSYRINNLEADLENLRRENSKLRSENEQLQQALKSE